MQSSTSTSKAISIKRRGQLRTTSTGSATLSAKTKSECLEIEEISKKISEHADALYRTWKSRGLVPPTDLIELYTVEAAAVAAAGTSKEALQSTAGLQNLVNTFVIKDKEQRNNNGGNGRGAETSTAKKTAKLSTTSQINKFRATNVPERTTTLISATTTLTTMTTTTTTAAAAAGTVAAVTESTYNNARTPTTSTAYKISHGSNVQNSAQNNKQTVVMDQINKTTDDHLHKYSKAAITTTTTAPINNLKQKHTKLKTFKMNDEVNGGMEGFDGIDEAIVPNNSIIKTQSFTSSMHSPLEKFLPTTTTANLTKLTSSQTSNTLTNASNALKKNLNFDVDLDLKFDLNLNVQQLSQLQTQNLRKIKELLHDNNIKTPTRIPTPANSAFSTHAREKKPLKITTASLPSSTSSTSSLSSSSLLLVNDIRQQQQQHKQWANNENRQDVKKFAEMERKGYTNELIVNGATQIAHDSSIKDRESQALDTKALMRQSLQGVFDDKENGNCNGINKSQKFLANTTVTNSISSVINSHPNANTNMSTMDIEYIIQQQQQQQQQQQSNNQVIGTNVRSVQSDVASVIKTLNTSHAAISSNSEIESATTQITATTTSSSSSSTTASTITPITTTTTPITTTTPTPTTTTTIIKNKTNKRTKSTSKIKDQKLKDNPSIIQQASTSDINTPTKAETATDSNVLLPLSLSVSLSPSWSSSSSSTSSTSTISTISTTSTAQLSSSSLSPISSSSDCLLTSSDTTVISLPNNMETARRSNSDGNRNSCITDVSPMLTPMKLKSPRNHLGNGQEKNLRSNFLTRGSVAERVLMFEKCPDVRHAFLNIKRPEIVESPKSPQIKVKLHSTPPQPPKDHTSLQREYKALKSVYIPRFYFPHGKPQPQIAAERTLRGILSAFDTFPNNQVTKDELPRILKICGLPFYWRMPVLIFCQQGSHTGLVERQRFVEFWKQMNVYCHEEASRFVYILSRGQRFRNYILPEDLVPLVQDVVDTHPGLAFLKEATEFHSRYVHTVIARIFYSVNRSWSGKISMSELKKSDLLEILCLLEEEDDINQIMAFFSYEHFYVIYCKFWELDKDHDLLINQDDLAHHSDHALSTRIIERIFSGCVTRNDNRKNSKDEPKMSYTDFVWFLLSEEDKRTPTAIEYWFRCMDLDGDGLLSMYELEYFYEEQQQRMESIGIESLPFEDCLCQMLDMIKPQNRDAITLGDLKRCKMTHVFFDTFFNLEKYLDHEQRDPFATQRDEYSSDWDRFAAQEYELLITEENE